MQRPFLRFAACFPVWLASFFFEYSLCAAGSTREKIRRCVRKKPQSRLQQRDPEQVAHAAPRSAGRGGWRSAWRGGRRGRINRAGAPPPPAKQQVPEQEARRRSRQQRRDGALSGPGPERFRARTDFAFDSLYPRPYRGLRLGKPPFQRGAVVRIRSRPRAVRRRMFCAIVHGVLLAISRRVHACRSATPRRAEAIPACAPRSGPRSGPPPGDGGRTRGQSTTAASPLPTGNPRPDARTASLRTTPA